MELNEIGKKIALFSYKVSVKLIQLCHSYLDYVR